MAPEFLGMCRWVLGNRLRIGPADGDGWVEVEIRGHSVEALAGELAGLAVGLDVRAPSELRERLAHIGRALVARYETA